MAWIRIWADSSRQGTLTWYQKDSHEGEGAISEDDRQHVALLLINASDVIPDPHTEPTWRAAATRQSGFR